MTRYPKAPVKPLVGHKSKADNIQAAFYSIAQQLNVLTFSIEAIITALEDGNIEPENVRATIYQTRDQLHRQFLRSQGIVVPEPEQEGDETNATEEASSGTKQENPPTDGDKPEKQNAHI